MQLDTNSSDKNKTARKIKGYLEDLLLNEHSYKIKHVKAFELHDLNKYTKDKYDAESLIHELGAPITSIKLNIDDIKAKEKRVETQTALDLIRISLNQIENLISTYTHTESNEKQSINVFQEIATAIKICSQSDQNIKIYITKISLKNVTLTGNKTKFMQIILNILTNAIEAHQHSEKADKEVKITIKKTNFYIIIKVSDNANGMSPQQVQNALEPKYTSKNGHKGLGLYICNKIAKDDFDGSIKITSSFSLGTTLAIKLKHR